MNVIIYSMPNLLL